MVFVTFVGDICHPPCTIREDLYLREEKLDAFETPLPAPRQALVRTSTDPGEQATEDTT